VEDVRASAPVVETVESVSKAPASDEDDDTLSYFAKLAES
ncbi:MAG: single-stranded DNA-binding protein, partial [Flavobacteriaceae bacterium]|nr:single-stranded DNA-binding protein [Flavobacteriaceae bacterium]